MSWSVNAIGKPEDVVTYLEAQSEKQSGQCKVEYDAALPHLIGLVRENFSVDNPNLRIKLSANGHGGTRVDSETKQTVQAYRNCAVTLETFNANFVG